MVIMAADFGPGRGSIIVAGNQQHGREPSSWPGIIIMAGVHHNGRGTILMAGNHHLGRVTSS